MDPLLECCEQNLSKSNFVLLEDSFIQKNCDVVTYSCLSECNLCAQKFYALFEGTIIIGETPVELIEKIKQCILLHQQEFE